MYLILDQDIQNWTEKFISILEFKLNWDSKQNAQLQFECWMKYNTKKCIELYYRQTDR